MPEIVLVRHGKTAGNLEHRYIGCCTDEPLCEEGRKELSGKRMPAVECIYVSPMKRCIETAKLLWPDHPPQHVVPNLRETDFGDFENKNYEELSGNPDYQAWVDSGGTLPFPNGEATEFFRNRCCHAFEQIVEELPEAARVGIVAHGGTIMAILERFGYPEMTYFDYQVKNGCGYLLTPVEGTERWNYRYLP